MKFRKSSLRATALTLAFALAQAAFGPEAWAQVRAVAVDAPIGAASLSAAGARAGASSISAATSVGSLSVGFAPTSSALAAPAAFATTALAAPAAPAPAAAPSASAVPSADRFAAPAAEAAAAQAAAPAAASPSGSISAPSADWNAHYHEFHSAAHEPAVSPAETAHLAEHSAGVEERVLRRFAELRRLFAGRLDSSAVADSIGGAATDALKPSAFAAKASGLTPAAPNSPDKVAGRGGGDNAPPTPASGPNGPSGDGGGKKAAWLGLGVAGVSIIAYALTMQVGIEAQGVAMPQLTENAFKDFTLLPLVTVFASIGSMIGQPMSKFFTERFGLAKTFYAANALRALSLGAMVLLFGFGHMSMPLMMGFYFVNGIVTGVAATAEGTLKKLILAERGVSQQNFRTWWQFLAETLAVPAPIFFGALVHTLGAIGAPLVTGVYPVAILLGLMLAYVLHVYPLNYVKKASDQAAAQAPAAKDAARTGVVAGFKNAALTIFQNMEEGKSYVMSMPYLKYALMSAVSFDLFNSVIYRLIAPGYGKMTGGAAGLSSIQGNIVGMFSLGGLLLSITFIVLERFAKKRAAKSPPTNEQARAAERASLLRWMLAGIPALALLATMGFHIALPLAPLIFLGTNWMPSSMLAAALVPFGFFQVAASIKLNSYFQERLPQDAGKVQKALSFAGSVSTALSIVTLLSMRPLFSAVDAFNPFPWLAAALVPIGVGLFFLRRKLSAATKPEAIAAADAAQTEREAGGTASKAGGAYVGLILGIVSAAVVITALPMIPGVAPALAGLGVLVRFAINLGLTFLLPGVGAWLGRAQGLKKDSAKIP